VALLPRLWGPRTLTVQRRQHPQARQSRQPNRHTFRPKLPVSRRCALVHRPQAQQRRWCGLAAGTPNAAGNNAHSCDPRTPRAPTARANRRASSITQTAERNTPGHVATTQVKRTHNTRRRPTWSTRGPATPTVGPTYPNGAAGETTAGTPVTSAKQAHLPAQTPRLPTVRARPQASGTAATVVRARSEHATRGRQQCTSCDPKTLGAPTARATTRASSITQTAGRNTPGHVATTQVKQMHNTRRRPTGSTRGPATPTVGPVVGMRVARQAGAGSRAVDRAIRPLKIGTHRARLTYRCGCAWPSRSHTTKEA
jgi:hypothetical protein